MVDTGSQGTVDEKAHRHQPNLPAAGTATLRAGGPVHLSMPLRQEFSKSRV
jgi:hypothetical protein